MAFDLHEPSFINWIKGSLGLKYLKQGLQGPVDCLIKRHHKKLLHSVKAVNCTECTIDNLLPHHKSKQCFHKYPTRCWCNKQGRRKCPNSFCSKFYDLILKDHAEANPTWQNTDPRRWYSDHWSLAQCFVATHGYVDKNSAEETDATGLLSIMLNNFELLHSIDSTENIRQAREIRNDLMHKYFCNIPDEKLDELICKLTNVLKDKKFLWTEMSAKSAVKILEKLKDTSIEVTTQDKNEVIEDNLKFFLKESLEEIDKRKQDIIQTSIKKLEEYKKSITDISNQSIAKLKHEALSQEEQFTKKATDVGSRHLQTFKESATKHQQNLETAFQYHCDSLATSVVDHTKAIDEKCQHHHQKLEETESRMETKLETTAQCHQNVLASRAKDHTSDLDVIFHKQHKSLESTGSRLEQTLETTAQQKYEMLVDFAQLKKDLKTDLITFYRECHSMFPLSPLLGEHEAALIEFYVPPTLFVVDPYDKARRRVNSYADIFEGNSRPCRNIYLSAKAGLGKTVFSKFMAVVWCQCHQPEDKYRDHFTNFTQDIEIMKRFEFLFLIILRDVKRNQCDVDSMIKSQILISLPRSDSYSKLFLSRILREEECLIIIDGLDEWTHQNDKCDWPKNLPDIPHRKVGSSVTFLSTTRPWKFDVLGLPSSKVDHRLELGSLKQYFLYQLGEKVITQLNATFGQNRTCAEFMTYVENKPWTILTGNPLILMHLVCLWYENEPPGKSICEVYSKILEFFLKRGQQKIEATEFSQIHVDNVKSESKQLPNVFQKFKLCNQSNTFVEKLGMLAFRCLFSDNPNCRLVFDKAISEDILSASELKLALKIGILTQTKAAAQTLTYKRCSISFIHKTYQEFLAALHISLQNILPADMFSVYDSAEKVLDISNVLIFLSGLNSAVMNTLYDDLSVVISNDKNIKNFRSSCYNVKDYITAVINHSLGMQYDGTRESPIMSELYVSASDTKEMLIVTELGDMMSRCLEENELCGYGDMRIPLNDIILARKEINSLLKYLKRKKLVDVKSIFGLDVFTVLRDELQNVQCLERLDVMGPGLDHMRNITEMAVIVRSLWSRTITALSISNINMYDEVIDLLQSLTSLSVLSLCDMSASCHHMEMLCKYISQRIHMRKLLLDFKSPKTCESHMMTMTALSSLSTVGVKPDECLSAPSVCHLLRLTDHHRLEVLKLNYIGKTYVELPTACPALEVCEIHTQLHSYKVTNILSARLKELAIHPFSDCKYESREDLLHSLPRLKNLERLTVCSFRFDKGREIDIAQCSKHLKLIHFQQVKMSSASFHRFLLSLQKVNQTVDVVLGDGCIIKPEKKFEELMNQMKTSQNFKVEGSSPLIFVRKFGTD